MVKVSFNSALSQKDPTKDAETLIPKEEDQVDAEAAVPVRVQSRAWCWCMCLGLALMLSGVVVGGALYFRYRDYISEEGEVFYCGVNYREEDFMVVEEEEVEVEVENPMKQLQERFDEFLRKDIPLKQLQERLQILEEEQVELISVPVPDFENGDPADIVHDFQRMLTAYLDLKLNKCYVTPLNASIVMPPRDLLELLVNVREGRYLPQSYLVHEEMVVTERIENVDELGRFISNLCRDKETFRLQRHDRSSGMQKRDSAFCYSIRHFESRFVVETLICEP